MAVDLDAIRNKLAKLSGQQLSAVMWRPEPGEYKIRMLPWSNLPKGEILVERWFYYGIGRKSGIVAPRQFGKPDPINEFIVKLHEENTPESLAMAKRLYPKMKAFAPIIVRGSEGAGVKLWGLAKTPYQRILSFYLDEDIGDVSDLTSGFDLKVKVTKRQGTFGTMYNTEIDPMKRPSPLSTDANQAKTWLGSLPNIDDIFPQKSYDEVKEIFEAWTRAGSPIDAVQNDGDGTEVNTKRDSGRETKPEQSRAASASIDDVFKELADGNG